MRGKMIVTAVLLAAMAANRALGQVPPSTILTIDVANYVEYSGDIYDPLAFAKNPNITPPAQVGSAAAEIYDAAAGAFSATGNMITGRTNHTATLLNDGSLLMAGGFSPGGCQEPLLASAELYHPALAPLPPVLLSLAGSSQGAILHAGTAELLCQYD